VFVFPSPVIQKPDVDDTDTAVVDMLLPEDNSRWSVCPTLDQKQPDNDVEEVRSSCVLCLEYVTVLVLIAITWCTP